MPQKTVNFTRARHKLSGPEGLIVAVIATATQDYCRGVEPHKRDALLFFGSRTYEHYLTWLGLPNRWLPESVEEIAYGES